MIHLIELKGSTAKVVGESSLTLGVWGDYGNERLLLTYDADWATRVVSCTFINGKNRVEVLADAEGYVVVPAEAVAKENDEAVIVIAGVTPNSMRYTVDLMYRVLERTKTGKTVNTPTTPSVAEQAALQSAQYRNEARAFAQTSQAAANEARFSADNAAASKTAAETAKTDAESARSDAQAAKTAAEQARTDAANSAAQAQSAAQQAQNTAGGKVDKAQGASNAGKVLAVGTDGNVTLADMPTGGGGTSGTTNYNDLVNKLSINGIELSGNKTTEQLGIHIPTVPDKLPNPNALTINGQRYDGSAPVNMTLPTGNNVTVDTTLSKAGQSADAAAVGTAIAQLNQDKVDKNQGVENSGKVLTVGADGNIALAEMPAGGGGSGESKPYRLIKSINITEPVKSILVSTDENGQPFSLTDLYIEFANLKQTNSGTTTSMIMISNLRHEYILGSFSGVDTYKYNLRIMVNRILGTGRYRTSVIKSAFALNNASTSPDNIGYIDTGLTDLITRIAFDVQWADARMTEGTLKIYGRDA